MLIVHQMAKVGSRSWVEAARRVSGVEPAHVHFMAPENRARIAAAYEVPAARHTLANMLMPRALLRNGRRAWDQMDALRRGGERVRLITGMREPVARSMSVLLFMADFYGDTSRPLHPCNPPSADDLLTALRDIWKKVLAEQEPETDFEWLSWYLIRAYRTWFDEEFFAAHGVDILAHEFPAGRRTLRVKADFADVLVYRIEDMRPGAPGHAHLLTAASNFLAVQLEEFPRLNTGETRRSRNVLAEASARFCLPDAMLDEIYGAPSVRHFYSSDEIRGFKSSWRARHF